MAGKHYRVQIGRGEQQLEAEGDRAFVLEMLKRFEGGVGGSSASRSGRVAVTDPAAVASSKATSVGEFIRQFGFKKHTDLVLAFGYYLEQHSGMKEFTSADINNCYYEAKMEPSNVSQSIIQNIHRGVMMEAKGVKGDKGKRGAKQFVLTASGENHVKKVAGKAHDGS